MIDHFLKYLEYEKRYSQHTLLAYEDDLRQLSEFLLHQYELDDFSSVKHVHLRGWIVSMVEKGLSPSSINRRIATSKSFYKFLLAREEVEVNPASRLKPLKTESKLPNFVRASEMIKLLDQLEFQAGYEGVRDKLVIELLYATGIRLSELIELREMNLNLTSKTIKVLGKRNKERLIPIHDFVVKSTREYLTLKEEMENVDRNVLLTTDRGEKLYPMFVYRMIEKYLSMVTTLSKRSPHVLRHTFATHLLDKGADLNAVKDLLGHTSLAATQVYTHNSMDKLKKVFEQAHPKA